MKKFYSLVLMAAALLIGTNAWADYPANWLQAQFDTVHTENLVGTVTITMEDNITLTEPVYLGTATVDEPRKSIILDMNGHHITMDATTWVSTKGNVFCSMFTITHGELLIRNNNKSVTSTISMTGKGYDYIGSDSKRKLAQYNNIFNVAGSYKSSRWVKSGNTYVIDESAAKNTRNEGWFTHLEIGEGVKVVAENTIYGAGISIDGYYTNYHAMISKDATATTGVFDASLQGSFGNVCLYNRSDAPAYNTVVLAGSAGEGVAYGVRVDVYGDIEFATAATEGKAYGIKLNGGLKSSLKAGETFWKKHCWSVDQAYAATYGATSTSPDSYSIGNDAYEAHKLDTVDAPFLHVHSSAHIIAAAEINEATAIYCSGYGKTLIEGACSGNSGVNVKSGTVEIHDAEIICTATESTTFLSTNGNKATGSGGVVVNSVDGRAGDIEVTISGDSKVSTDYGYAIVETVTANNDGTKVSAITIDGGTIQGGAPTAATEGGGAIKVSEDTQNNDDAEVVVYGTNLTGNTEVQAGTAGDLDDLLPKTGAVITEVIVDGKPTIVVSQGETPDEVTESAADYHYDIMDATEKSITWTGTADQIINGNKTLDYLEMNLTTGTNPKVPVAQQLTIEAGNTLTVGRVVLGEAAVIIVKPGAKFIVTGAQGIVAPKASNIVIKTQEGNPAYFLFNPAVTSNRHPNATVEFVSKSYTKSGTDWAKQRFGIPTHKALTEITAKYSGTDVATGFEYFDYDNDAWTAIGFINTGGGAFPYDQMAQPFAYYQMQHNTPNTGTIVTMKGELVGNTDGEMHIRGNFWNGLANSYMAPINAQQLIAMIPNTVQKAFYLYDIDDESGQAAWFDVTLDFLTDIQPMQPFMIRNTKAAADVTINYGDAVYYPTTGETKPNAAPARRVAANNNTKAQIIVKGENSIDRVGVVESDEFSSEFDNGHETEKFMNDGINMYVSANEKMGTYATNDLENTYVGFQTVNGGTYTIKFANVNGEELTLVDLETGARVAMIEGNAYEFTADANSVNDYRFQITKISKVATDIENTEAVKNVKGIYTITGQYVGEMNVWNTLPAGVYVVNGEKRVK